MQKFLLYDTDEGLDFNIASVSSDAAFPWVSCRVFRIHDQENVYFEVIKSEEYLEIDTLKETEKSIGTFESFLHAAQAAELIVKAYRSRNNLLQVKRTLH